MKKFTQLTLVSAMAISGHAMAMQSLDDEALSAATGQDGITIVIAGDIHADVVVHDKDGYQSLAAGGPAGPAATPTRTALGFTATAETDISGAIVLDGFSIEDTSAVRTGIRVHVDADGNAGDPVLNVNIGLPDELTINTGDIYVASSDRSTSDATAYTDMGAYANQVKILDNIEVVLGDATMNLQLGNATQGAMIKLSGTIAGGLQLSNISLYQPLGVAGITYGPTALGSLEVNTDASGNALAGIHLGGVQLLTTGTSDLTMDTEINAVNGGLKIDMNGSHDINLRDVKLGHKLAAASLGDIALTNVTLPSLVITGH
ncbi:hypothetical protein MKI79_04890 [Acinetobacter sp. A3.8]|uniref:DUF6160 domain-containing protein n=1 Tax=Acinetobacter sedimenti TaxID=2919922 RepID=A0A9X2B8L7_9GAMM|nr:DUF6160 family protein [Acinetobacter sedimenti]MCJ8146244.1 hypothetical protein [Acinetobacter sedimenti]